MVAVIGLFTLQYAGAHPGRGMGFGGGFGGNCQNWSETCDPSRGAAVDQEKVDAFLEETVELRSQMIDKRSAYQKLTLTKDYDRNVAAKMIEEMDKIRTQIHEKAEKAGLNNNGFRRGQGFGHGPGMGWGNHRGYGQGGGCGKWAR